MCAQSENEIGPGIVSRHVCRASVYLTCDKIFLYQAQVQSPGEAHLLSRRSHQYPDRLGPAPTDRGNMQAAGLSGGIRWGYQPKEASI